MKKVEIKILGIYNFILTGLLTLLGFTSCSENVVEYGTPSALFKFIGKVESSETEAPIGNIKVTLQQDISYTNNLGEYEINDAWGFPEGQSFNIHFEDIDGTDNGEFENMDTIVEVKDPKFTNGDGDWYAGETTTEFDIQLKPKD